MYLEICLIIFGAAVSLLVIFCIPILIQIWRTIKDVELTLETLNQRLPMILKNLEEITTNINNSTTAINCEVNNITSMISRFQVAINNIIEEIQCITPIFRKSPVFQSIKNVFAVAKGIRVFCHVLLAKPATKV